VQWEALFSQLNKERVSGAPFLPPYKPVYTSCTYREWSYSTRMASLNVYWYKYLHMLNCVEFVVREIPTLNASLD